MKFNKLLVLVVLILLVLPATYSAPAWKKQSQPTQPTQTTPTTIKEIVIINNTTTPQQTGFDWNMIGAIIAIIAVLVSLIGWFLTRKRSSNTSKYLDEINQTYSEYKGNSDKCEMKLVEVKAKIEKELATGKITEQSFDILDRRIESYLGNIRKGIVNKFDLSPEIKKRVDQALKDGKISKEEYESIKNIKEIALNKKERLLKLLKKWEKD